MSRPTPLKAGERVFHTVLLLFSLGVLFEAYRIDGLALLNSAGAFPLMLGGIMLLSMLVILLQNRRRPRLPADGAADEARQFMRHYLPPVVLIFMLLSVAYLALLVPLGFVIATPLFLFVAQLFLRRGRPVAAALISVGATAAVYALFKLVFQVYLP